MSEGDAGAKLPRERRGAETGEQELRSVFRSTAGGVMTEEVGAVTGELELVTRPTAEGKAVEAYVRYRAAEDLYAVSGSPLRAVRWRPHHAHRADHGASEEPAEHRWIHDRILKALTTPGEIVDGNERAVDLGGDAPLGRGPASSPNAEPEG